MNEQELENEIKNSAFDHYYSILKDKQTAQPKSAEEADIFIDLENPLAYYDCGLIIFYAKLKKYGIPGAVFYAENTCSFITFSFDPESPFFINDPKFTLDSFQNFLANSQVDITESDLIEAFYFMNVFSLDKRTREQVLAELPQVFNYDKWDTDKKDSNPLSLRIERELADISRDIDSFLVHSKTQQNEYVLSKGASDFIFLFIPENDPKKFSYIYYAPSPSNLAAFKDVMSIRIDGIDE